MRSASDDPLPGGDGGHEESPPGRRFLRPGSQLFQLGVLLAEEQGQGQIRLQGIETIPRPKLPLGLAILFDRFVQPRAGGIAQAVLVVLQQDGIIHPRGNVRRVELQGLAIGLGRAGPIHAGPEVAAQQVVGQRAGQIGIGRRRVRRELDRPAGLGPGRLAQPGLQEQPRVMRVLVGAVGIAGPTPLRAWAKASATWPAAMSLAQRRSPARSSLPTANSRPWPIRRSPAAGRRPLRP